MLPLTRATHFGAGFLSHSQMRKMVVLSIYKGSKLDTRIPIFDPQPNGRQRQDQVASTYLRLCIWVCLDGRSWATQGSSLHLVAKSETPAP